jgi:hypothetical protein
MILKNAGIGNNAVKDKATQIMDKLLLTYLSNKPNLREYLLAFVSEMDFLLEQINEVYLGRFLENAVGEQLDVIGAILNQNRRIVLPSINFGFQAADGVIAGMADESSPAIGGVFRDGSYEGGGEAPLTDSQYRRLLLVIASCMNKDVVSTDEMYYFLCTLFGRAPSFMELEQHNTAGSNLRKRVAVLKLKGSEMANEEVSLANYAIRYFIPAGTSFSIQLI